MKPSIMGRPATMASPPARPYFAPDGRSRWIP